MVPNRGCGLDVPSSSDDYLYASVHVELVAEHVVVVADSCYLTDHKVDVLGIRGVIMPLHGVVRVEFEQANCIYVSLGILAGEGDVQTI